MNRISYFVYRISLRIASYSYVAPSPLGGEGWGEGERKNVGFEANPNASCGRKVSFTNDSETGRFRGKSEAMEEKESQSLRQFSLFEFRPKDSAIIPNFSPLLRDSPNDDPLIHLPDCRCRILLTCPYK